MSAGLDVKIKLNWLKNGVKRVFSTIKLIDAVEW
jgi:hypothetical protein